MQYYTSKSISNIKNDTKKLFFILKKKAIDYEKYEDNIVLNFNKNTGLNFVIYFNDLIPQFIIVNNNNSDYIASKCEEINMNIDNFELVEDIICEIKNIYDNSLKLLPIDYHIAQKNINKFEILLDEKKEKYIQENKTNLKLNYELKIFSLRSYVEMLGDQLKKIYNIKNLDLEIDNFPNIKIYMYGFDFKGSDKLKITIDMEINLNLLISPPNINITSNKILKDNILIVISQLKPFSEINSWSAKYSIYDSILNIFNMINTYGEIKHEYANEFDEIINDLEYLVSIKNQNISSNKLLEIFDKDFFTNSNKLSEKECKQNSNYWKKGTGYGHIGTKTWDVDEYIKIINEKKNTIMKKFIKFAELLEQEFKLKNNNSNNSNNMEEFMNRIINLLIYWIDCDE